MFKILKKDTKTKARLGILRTPHGDIKTPSYVIVATHAKIKCLKPNDIKKTKTQVVIANTYHLWDKALKNKKEPHLVHRLLDAHIPVITDSGGFQVFSLGFGRENHVGKILTMLNIVNPQIIHRRKNIKITGRGVYFSIGGKKQFLGPKLSMQIQESLGADIIFAFDECTSPLDSLAYNNQAIIRTHRWAKESLAAKTRKDQILFGIVQGGRFKNLRIKSAKFISSLPFDGFGIGGSFGKNEMIKTLKWIIPYLPEKKPRHLLGIGRIEDIFNAVENGIDLFDCVIPTREARHGRIYTKQGHYDICKSIYKNEVVPLEKKCKCWSCQKVSKSKLHNLFKNDLPVQQFQGKRWATIHNVWFFNNLLEEIRKSIQIGKFTEFKKKFLRSYPTKVPFVGVKNVF